MTVGCSFLYCPFWSLHWLLQRLFVFYLSQSLPALASPLGQFHTASTVSMYVPLFITGLTSIQQIPNIQELVSKKKKKKSPCL